MKVSVDFSQNILPDRYSKYAEVSHGRFALISFPFQVEDLPEETKTLAWSFIDMDAIPVCGFPYVHWVVANAPTLSAIPEDFSRQDVIHVEGINSQFSPLFPERDGSIKACYVGPCPPDRDHAYTLNVYALDTALDLDHGFYLNEMLHAMKGHVLAQASLDVIGRV